MKRIKYIFLNVVLSLQLIFASSIIPEDSFIRAGSVVGRSEKPGHYFFEVTQTKPMDSMLSTESEDSDLVKPQSKRLKKGEEPNLEVKNIELPYKLVADPAYDQTFKRIFDCTIDKVSGEKRLMSLLNSILFPDVDENGFKIRKLESQSNEATNLGRKTAVGVLRFDIACRCSCYKVGEQHNEKVIDVEMQTGPQLWLQDRLLDYGNELRSKNESTPIIILTFLNYYPKYHTKGDETAWLGFFYRDMKTGKPIKPLDNVLDIYSIDLTQESAMLKNDTPIYIAKKIINNTTGKEWLKLLSIRQWATIENNKYVIPDTAKDPAVKSAIEMLSCITEDDLKERLREERDAYAMLRGAQETGLLEGKIETARNMLNEECNIDFICKMTGLPIEQINALKEELEKTNSSIQ